MTISNTFTVNKLTMNVTTKSGKEMSFSTTDPVALSYYATYKAGDPRGHMVWLYTDREGELRLSRPKYSTSRALRVALLEDPSIESIEDDASDDSWL